MASLKGAYLTLRKIFPSQISLKFAMDLYRNAIEIPLKFNSDRLRNWTIDHQVYLPHPQFFDLLNNMIFRAHAYIQIDHKHVHHNSIYCTPAKKN
jgi:hypothetical protein